MKYELINKDCFNCFSDMEDESIDAIITDPPYGILKHKIESNIDIPIFFEECYRILKPNSFLCFFGQQPTLTTWNNEAFKLFTYKNEVIWYKRQSNSPFLDMNRVFENIMIVTKGKRKFNDVRLDYVDLRLSLSEYLNKDSFDKDHNFIKQFLRDKKLLSELIDSLNGKPDYCQNFKGNGQAASLQTNNLKEKRIYQNAKTVLT